MHNKEILLKSINKHEDRLVIAKLLDKKEISERTKRLVHTEFLDPHQVSLADKVLASFNICEYSFYGGYSDSERAVAIFYPDFTSEDELKEFQYGIFKVLEITSNARENLSHRDYLGALMGLGIRREVTGDIIVSDYKCSVIVLDDIASYIEGNLFKVGNTGVEVKVLDLMDLVLPEPKTSEIKATVATLRLDSFCVHAFGIARNKAVEVIKAGRVNLNWEVVLNPDKAVKEGDMVSLKGKGRAVLDKTGGKTRKDRIAIIIKKFL